jgi:hypothetical protein
MTEATRGRATRRSHLMHGALELLADGVAPRDAALSAGVTLQALYRAMRQEGIGTRCPTCGKLTGRQDGRLPNVPAEPTDYEARVQAWEAKGCTRSDAQGIVDAELMVAASKDRLAPTDTTS